MRRRYRMAARPRRKEIVSSLREAVADLDKAYIEAQRKADLLGTWVAEEIANLHAHVSRLADEVESLARFGWE